MGGSGKDEEDDDALGEMSQGGQLYMSTIAYCIY